MSSLQDDEASEPSLIQLLEIINRHLPPEARGYKEQLADARSLQACPSSIPIIAGWGSVKDKKSLDSLRTAIARAQAAIKQMSPEVGRKLDQEMRDWRFGKDKQSLNDLNIFLSVNDALAAIAAGETGARRFEDGRTDPGRTNWLAVVIVDECRRLWKVRAKKSAPWNVVADAERPDRGSFAKFATEVLKAFGGGADVESALRVLRSNKQLSISNE